MVVANFRFYAELNEFLPPPRRQRRFAHRCADDATLKNAVESLGVPHTEIELVVVNGESADFSQPLRARDSVGVYPKFFTFDIEPLCAPRPALSDPRRFIADAHLGGLARYLRMLGFDTIYRNAFADREIAELATNDRRIVLTRDRDLLMHRAIVHGCFVRGERALAQLRGVVERFDLAARIRPFRLCLRCNEPLAPVSKDDVRERLPARTAMGFDEFHACPNCARIYWKGSHWQRMERLIAGLAKSVGPKGDGRADWG